MHELDRVLHKVMVLSLVGVGGGIATATLLRRRHLKWTWSLLGLAPVIPVAPKAPAVAAGLLVGSLLSSALGAAWHGSDLRHGADLAEAARRRIGITVVLRRRVHHVMLRRKGWVSSGWLAVGCDRRGMPVCIPAGGESGCHTLVLGATGSGKTVTQTWLVSRLIEHGHAAIVIDPKGDRDLQTELEEAAWRAGVEFIEWTPEGPSAYNPYAQGSETEIADKALAGEVFTEPHYQRQAQRYLGHAVHAMHSAEIPVTPGSLMAHLDPGRLEVTARTLRPAEGERLQGYLDSLSERQRRDLAGVRDRLSILAESDAAHWLEPNEHTPAIDLRNTVVERSVVYFRLDADRRSLLAGMLAAAVVSDLVTLVASLQSRPIPTVVLIDEFSAVAAGQVARLFGRARSAGVSLVLGTQELADLKGVQDSLREQVLANVAAVVAHRQNVPESAELIAGVAGTQPVWLTTERVKGSTPEAHGTRKRGYEYAIHPSQIKQLPTGHAAVIAPGSGARPTITRMFHPADGIRRETRFRAGPAVRRAIVRLRRGLSGRAR